MRSAAMVLGIVGGIFGLLFGAACFTFGSLGAELGVEGSGLFMLSSVGFPVAGLVGAVVVKRKPATGGLLMLLGAIGFTWLVGLNFLSLVPGIPLALGGALGFYEARATKPPAANSVKLTS